MMRPHVPSRTKVASLPIGTILGTHLVGYIIYYLYAKIAVEYNVVTQNSFQVKERHGHPQSYDGHSIVGWNRKRYHFLWQTHTINRQRKRICTVIVRTIPTEPWDNKRLLFIVLVLIDISSLSIICYAASGERKLLRHHTTSVGYDVALWALAAYLTRAK